MTFTKTNFPKLYNSWRAMKGRCNNPNQLDYKYYGGKGIKYAVEWESFVSFASWALSTGYEYGFTIDRVDSNKDYVPTNCRWISHVDNVVRSNKERYLSRYEDAFSYWKSIDGNITGTELASIFEVSFSTGCKWIRQFNKIKENK